LPVFACSYLADWAKIGIAPFYQHRDRTPPFCFASAFIKKACTLFDSVKCALRGWGLSVIWAERWTKIGRRSRQSGFHRTRWVLIILRR
jgi:hypothetical protein